MAAINDRSDKTTGVHERSLAIDEEKAISAEKTNEESPSKAPRAQAVVNLVRYTTLLLCNTLLWYVTNGMNGIALQSFASEVREFRGSKEDLLSNIANMTLVTGLQLAFGVLIGFAMLKVFSIMDPSAQHRSRPHSIFQISRQEAFLGSLHSIGSMATNLGFTYGSASLIQILKLLEPFETLVLSQLLLPNEGECTVGVFSSMIFVVGAAVSLIRIRPTKPHTHAVVFALLSGISLSARNVMQRRQHVQVQVDAQHDDYSKNVSKVERSVDLFTRLSFHSAVMAFGMAIPLNAILLATSPSHVQVVKMVFTQALNWRVLTWHPLYNTFSMITLGFCSALTHSLLNAGKRVFAIVMAIVWFREGFTMATLLGLTAVAGGGCWYTLEAKAKKPLTQTTGVSRWVKLVISLTLIQTLLHLQTTGRNRA